MTIPGTATSCTTLVDLVRVRAQQRPRASAYTLLPDGDTGSDAAAVETLTYAALDRRARSVGAYLQSHDATGERVLLLYPTGLSFIVAFLACQYAGATAVPAYPPRKNQTLDRLRAIVDDADARLALTDEDVLRTSQRQIDGDPLLSGVEWHGVDPASVGAPDTWSAPTGSEDDVAFLQYTSGSTSAPKGVCVTHRNVLCNQAMIREAFGHTDETVARNETIAGWLPMYHDMGLIGNVLHPLYLGNPCVLMPPPAFLQKPVRWLEMIDRYDAHTSGGPNFAYDLCVDRTTPEQRDALDLRSWRVAFNGAEPINPKTLRRFADAFAPSGFQAGAFRPCYGLAEATLLVSGRPDDTPPTVQTFDAAALEHHRAVPLDTASWADASDGTSDGADGGSDDGSDDGSDGGSDDGSDGGSDDGSDGGSDGGSGGDADDASDGSPNGKANGKANGASPIRHDGDVLSLVGCGCAAGDERIRIVDPDTRTVCADGEVGEIWVAGDHVADGYWRAPEASRETFDAHLADTGGGPFLRTGDLGTWVDGELFVTGRRSDLIIIRGRNYYPQDLERVAHDSHDGLRRDGAAAFTLRSGPDGSTGDRLGVVVEVTRQAYRDLLGDDAAGVDLAHAVRQRLAETFSLQTDTVALIKPYSLPRTSSGKVQRRTTRDRLHEEALDALYVSRVAPGVPSGDGRGADPSFAAAPDRANGGEAPASPLPTPDAIRAMDASDRVPALVEALRPPVAATMNLAPSAVDPDRPLTAFGMDSLQAVQIQHAVESHFGVALSPAYLRQDVGLTDVARTVVDLVLDAPTPDAVAPDAVAPDAAGDADTHPLSPGQESLWVLYERAPDSAVYNIARALRLRGDVDLDALEQSVRRVTERHAALRTTVDPRDGDPVQVVHDDAGVPFDVTDARAWDRDRFDAHLATRADAPFDLPSEMPVRFEAFNRDDGVVLLFVVHHLAADFWSLEVLFDDLLTAYRAARRGHDAPLPDVPTSYATHARRQQARRGGDAHADLAAYWADELDGAPFTLALPTDADRPPVPSFEGAAVDIRIDASTTEALDALARAHETTLYTVLLAAYQTLLHRYSGQDDILVGSPAANRSSHDVADTVGYFVNPVVLRGRFDPTLTGHTLVDQLADTVGRALAHQGYPFADLVRDLDASTRASAHPLFQAFFVFQNAHRSGLDAPFVLGRDGGTRSASGLTLESVALPTTTEQFDLSLTAVRTGDGDADGGIRASLSYATDVFDAATAERMARHLRTLVTALAERPGEPLATAPLLGAADAKRLLVDWNDTSTSFDADGLIDPFATQAASRPDGVALAIGETHVTYAALAQRVKRWAGALQNRGVGPEVRVGVCADRSVDLVTALLAVWWAGGAYVPLDPGYPEERLRYVTHDADLALTLTADDAPSAAVATPDAPTLSLADLDADADATDALPVPVVASPEQAAYVIYTSGSTGRPKGVAVSQRSVTNRLNWMQTVEPLEPGESVVQKTPFSFDVSVWELFWPLRVGGRLVLMSPGAHRDPWAVRDLLRREQPVVTHFVPSMLHEFVDVLDGPNASDGDRNPAFPALRRIVSSGEALPASLRDRVIERLDGDARLHNFYGPTEAAVEVTRHPCVKDGPDPVPIGRPVENTHVYVLDASMQPVPVGVPGELYLGGVQLARGYHARPRQSATTFVPNPFADTVPEASSRLYRTGDRVAWRPDGTIAFFGRLDRQVQVRGHRVELGAVEAALLDGDGVRQAAVVLRADSPRGRELVAYVVRDADSPETNAETNPEAASGPARPLDADARRRLRDACGERLPNYMVPHTWVALDAIPQTPNGKVDRDALPAPPSAPGEPTSEGEPPRGDVETTIATIWKDVLGVDRVGRHDDFFERGGHSLLAIKVASRLQDAFNLDVSLNRLFQERTVARLGTLIVELQMEQSDDALSEQLLDELDDLDDDLGDDLDGLLDDTTS